MRQIVVSRLAACNPRPWINHRRRDRRSTFGNLLGRQHLATAVVGVAFGATNRTTSQTYEGLLKTTKMAFSLNREEDFHYGVIH